MTSFARLTIVHAVLGKPAVRHLLGETRTPHQTYPQTRLASSHREYSSWHEHINSLNRTSRNCRRAFECPPRIKGHLRLATVRHAARAMSALPIAQILRMYMYLVSGNHAICYRQSYTCVSSRAYNIAHVLHFDLANDCSRSKARRRSSRHTRVQYSDRHLDAAKSKIWSRKLRGHLSCRRQGLQLGCSTAPRQTTVFRKSTHPSGSLQQCRSMFTQ